MNTKGSCPVKAFRCVLVNLQTCSFKKDLLEIKT